MANVTRGRAGAPAPAPYNNLLLTPNAKSGNIPQTYFVPPNSITGPAGGLPFFAVPTGAGTATADMTSYLQRAVFRLSAAAATVGILKLPSATLLPLILGKGKFDPALNTIRIGMQIARAAIGGIAGKASGLFLSQDSIFINSNPGPTDLKTSCFGITGDGAGGWAFTAVDFLGVQTMFQPLVWPVATNQFCAAELRIVPGSPTDFAACEVWIDGSRQLSVPFGGAQLPIDFTGPGNYGLCAMMSQFCNAAGTLPDLLVSNFWLISQAP